MLVWDTHCCLKEMYLAHARDQLWKRKLLKNNKYNENYSPWGVYQAILSGAHTSLAGVSTLHLHYGTPTVLLLLLPFSFLGGPLLLLISGSDLLAFGSHDLGSFSPLQKGGILHYYFVPELLEVFHHPPLPLLLLCNSLSLSFLLGLFLHFSPSLLSRTLSPM